MEASSDIVATDRESAMGFAVSTVSYPEGGYELPELRIPTASRIERTVALALDERNRIRRRHAGPGYVHEVFDGLVWRIAAALENLDEVALNDAYRRFQQQREREALTALNAQEDEPT
jgi:hypothetical protein